MGREEAAYTAIFPATLATAACPVTVLSCGRKLHDRTATSVMTKSAATCRQGSVKHHCQAVPQRELVRKSCSFITFYFYVLSLEYPQALSSSISSDCNQRQHE